MMNLSTAILRLLLVVLMGTFMSPSFAWQMIDSHSETTIASLAGDEHHYEHELYHHHHEEDGDGNDDSAHSQIGHLLSHLPAVTHDIVSFALSETNSSTFSTCLVTFTYTTTDPPFKPPRHFLFV